MKICLLSTSFPRNKTDDAGIFIARLVEALSFQEITGTVISPHCEGAETDGRFANWNVVRVKYGLFSSGKLAYGSGILPNLKANPFLFAQIPGLLISIFLKALKVGKQSDLIHAHWLASAIPGLFAGKLCNKPLVITIRGEDLKLLGLPVVGTILKWLLRKSTEITTVSDHFVQKLQQHFPAKTIHLIPNGVTRIAENDSLLSEIKKKYEVDTFPYIIYAGRVVALKRLELLVRILSLLRDKSLHLLICGSVDAQKYVEQVKAEISVSSMQGRIHFLGNTRPDDYAVLLSGAKLYFSASEYEGRPNGVLEALAQGVPPVVSNIAGHVALIKNGRNGVLFDPDKLENCANLVNALLENKSDYQNMAVAAKESVKTLSWESCAASYINLYKHALSVFK